MIMNKRFDSAKLPLLPVLAAFALAFLGLLLYSPAPIVALDLPLPLAPPAAAAVLEIYHERCVVCPGAMGDGL